MIRYACPRCFTTFEVSDSKADAKFNCEVCGKRVQVPSPFTAPSAKPAVLAAPRPSETSVTATEAKAAAPVRRLAYVLLKCIGKAVVKNVVNLLTFGVGGDILVDAWDYWQEATREEQRPAQAQAVAQLSSADIREAVAQIVREEAAALPPAAGAGGGLFRAGAGHGSPHPARVPSFNRQVHRGGTAFHKPEDLLPLLPTGLPRFKAGDRPLPGVDWELEELLGVGGFGEVWKGATRTSTAWPRWR